MAGRAGRCAVTLVNIWSLDFRQHIARTVVTVEQHQFTLPPVSDVAGTIVRPSQIIDGLHLTATGLTPEFQDKLVHGFCNGVLTIEDQPEFVFASTGTRWESGTIYAAAIPFAAYLRRSCLPDWYVPDERFC